MSQTDKYYIQRCLNGHSDDFRWLVRRYQPVLLAHLAGRLGSRDRAEEAAQEAFVRAYFNLEKLRKQQSFFSWLIGIATRVAKEQQRSQQHRGQLPDSLPDKTPCSTVSQDQPLEQAIAELPDSYRQLILLRYYGGHSCSEVAQQLDMPVGTVTKTLSRAYAKLRELLQRQKNENSEVQK